MSFFLPNMPPSPSYKRDYVHKSGMLPDSLTPSTSPPRLPQGIHVGTHLINQSTSIASGSIFNARNASSAW